MGITVGLDKSISSTLADLYLHKVLHTLFFPTDLCCFPLIFTGQSNTDTMKWALTSISCFFSVSSPSSAFENSHNNSQRSVLIWSLSSKQLLLCAVKPGLPADCLSSNCGSINSARLQCSLYRSVSVDHEKKTYFHGFFSKPLLH